MARTAILTAPVRLPTPDPPAEMAVRDGLAYTLWLPPEEPRGGVVILHGADSCKESHHDFARAARSAGLAAVAFDQRGHGASEGALGTNLVEDVIAMAALLPPGPLALRGSSMGGYVALVAAERADAAAVVAICPASAEQLARGVRDGAFAFRAQRPDLEGFLLEHDLGLVVDGLGAPVLLLHADGDEQVPVAHSRELYARMTMPQRKLVVLPGGHHRSIQHDSELQGVALRFIARAFAGAAA